MICVMPSIRNVDRRYTDEELRDCSKNPCMTGRTGNFKSDKIL